MASNAHNFHAENPLVPFYYKIVSNYTAPTGDPHHLCLVSYNIPSGFKKKCFTTWKFEGKGAILSY